MSGVFWAVVIIQLSTMAGTEIIGYVVTSMVVFVMCVQAKQALLSFIPGTFLGACATFAADGYWQLVVPSLIVGAVFGYAMKTIGLWLHQKLGKT